MDGKHRHGSGRKRDLGCTIGASQPDLSHEQWWSLVLSPVLALPPVRGGTAPRTLRDRPRLSLTSCTSGGYALCSSWLSPVRALPPVRAGIAPRTVRDRPWWSLASCTSEGYTSCSSWLSPVLALPPTRAGTTPRTVRDLRREVNMCRPRSVGIWGILQPPG